MKDNIYDELSFRGLIAQQSSDELRERLKSPITVYCGFDPSADSLHVGNMMPVLMLKRFQQFGHKVIAVAGGSTGLIGDPRMVGERQLNDKETVEKARQKIEQQFRKYLDPEKTIFVNNYDWTYDVSVLDFLRDQGKYFNINYLLNKETIKSRLDTGISFTEFTYTILQAYDYRHLYETYNCQLQIGGNDQWGNLTSGLELIRKVHGSETEVYALTNPLVTKSDGTKFGKSEGGAIWIDPNMTSPYELYQFFFNSADSDVIDYLKYFTFLTEEEINELETSVKEEPHLRLAQKTLAKEIVTFIHGEQSYLEVEQLTKALFSGDISNLTAESIEQNLKQIEKFEVAENSLITYALIACELATSKRDAREHISNNAISINGEKVTDENYVISKANATGNKYLFVKRGKKKYAFIVVV